MTQRGILKEEIECLLSKATENNIIQSNKDLNAVLILGFINNKGFVVIKNKTDNKLITIRRMHKKEELKFNK
jgi:hypothetical protein